MASLTQEESQEYYQLEAKALESFMEHHNFHPSDWLWGAKKQRWTELERKIFNGQNSCQSPENQPERQGV